MSCICNICELKISHEKNITKHQTTEKCQTIKRILDKKEKIYIDKNRKLEDDNNFLNNKNIENTTVINELTKQLEYTKQELVTKDIQLKLIQDKYEDLRKIVEKAATKSTNNFKHKQDIVNDNMFQIDINLSNKQLNKTKYKDVPEDIIKNDIQSLKLKDNYQLEYREEDGYINITNLCKAGGKEFKSWNKNDKTKRFLDVLSATVRILTVALLKQEQGGNGERHTWAHPQVAVNIAQWISAEFDVLVSKWVYEIMLTGNVDIRNNKTTQELDIMNKENKLLKNRIKLLESKVLQKQPREIFEENKNVVYIVTTEYKEAQGHYKIGKAQDLQKRMSVYNTTDKHEVIYNTSCKTKKKMDLLEQIVHDRLESKRIEPNKEWFESEEDGEDLIKVIEDLKKVVNY